MNIERILMRSPSVSAAAQRADYRAQKERLRQQELTENLAAGQKRCFKCGQLKSLNEFYSHPQMADGRLNKCKECTKDEAAKRLSEKREYVQEYDRWRSKTDTRKEKLLVYQRTRRAKHPEKNKARAKVNREVYEGKLIPQPCSVCGHHKAEAHHHDYSKPLDVIWLCFKHHHELHGHITTAPLK